jgi:hypothetical protein
MKSSVAEHGEMTSGASMVHNFEMAGRPMSVQIVAASPKSVMEERNFPSSPFSTAAMPSHVFAC